MNIKIDEYNINGSYPSNVLLLIKKIPKTVFALKNFPFPGVSSNPAEINYPNQPVSAPGDSVTYNDLNCEVFVDEYFLNHREIFTWFINNTTGVYTDFEDIYSHGMIIFYNNSLKIPVLEIKFFNLHPFNVDNIETDNINTDEMTFNTIFKYDKYEPNYLKA